MSRFVFRPLLPEDTGQVEELLQNSSLKSFFTVCRVPSKSIKEYLTLNDAEFDSIIVEDKEVKNIVGIAFVVYRNFQFKKETISVAYLQQLFIIEKYRNGFLLARGYKYLKQLLEKRNPDLVLMVILNTNQQVQTLLTSNRSTLPEACKEQEILTLTFDLKRSKVKACKKITFEKNSDEVLDFIKENQNGLSMPVTEEKLKLWNISEESVLVKRENNEILQVLLLWDQSAFRSIRVIKYSPIVSLIRPIYNCYAYFTGNEKLPDIPWDINNVYGFSLIEKVGVKNNATEIIETAIAYLKNEGKAYLTLSIPKGYYHFSKGISYNSIESTIYSLWWNNNNMDKFKPLHLDVPFL